MSKQIGGGFVNQDFCNKGPEPGGTRLKGTVSHSGRQQPEAQLAAGLVPSVAVRVRSLPGPASWHVNSYAPPVSAHTSSLLGSLSVCSNSPCSIKRIVLLDKGSP